MSSRRSRGRGRGEWQTVAGSLWGVNIAIVAGTPQQLALVQLQPTASTLGTVPVGAAIVNEVHCQGQFLPTGGVAPILSRVGIGLSLNDWTDTGAGAWATQIPTLEADAERDNWLVLKTQASLIPSAALASSIIRQDVSFTWKGSVRIDEGKRLCLSFNASDLAGSLVLFCRFRQKWVF